MSKYFRAFALALAVAINVVPIATVATARDIHFPVSVSDVESAEATLRLPEHYKMGARLPVFVVFGGFESAAHVLDLLRSNRQVALASFDYPFSAPRAFRFPESVKALPELEALFPKTVRGIRELVAKLRGRPEIDPRQVVLIGASFGAPFAIAAAAQDPDIPYLVLVHAFGRVPDTLYQVILKSWVPRYGWISKPAAWILAHLGWRFLGIRAPEAWISHLDGAQSVLMIVAEHDSFIPRESSDELWRAVQSSRARTTRISMNSDHVMPGSERLIDQICEEIWKWLGG